MHTLNLLSKSIAKVKISGFLMQRFLLGASVTLILLSMAFAAVPLTDKELTDNFFKNDIIISDVDYAQVPLKTAIIRHTEENVRFRSDDSIRIEQVFIDPVKINSNTTDTLDNRTRKQMIFNNNMLGFFNILNENYLNDSSISSYKLDGKKLSVTYDLSKVNDLYFNDVTGNYELNNISGVVELTIEPLTNSDRASNFRRLNYVF